MINEINDREVLSLPLKQVLFMWDRVMSSSDITSRVHMSRVMHTGSRFMVFFHTSFTPKYDSCYRLHALCQEHHNFPDAKQ